MSNSLVENLESRWATKLLQEASPAIQLFKSNVPGTARSLFALIGGLGTGCRPAAAARTRRMDGSNDKILKMTRKNTCKQALDLPYWAEGS